MTSRVIAIAALVVVALGGMTLLAARKARGDTSEVQTLNVAVIDSVAKLGPGDEVCQSPVYLTARTDGMAFTPTAPEGPSSPIAIEIRDLRSRAVLSPARPPAGG
jgi:hypothetical protein